MYTTPQNLNDAIERELLICNGYIFDKRSHDRRTKYNDIHQCRASHQDTQTLMRRDLRTFSNN